MLPCRGRNPFKPYKKNIPECFRIPGRTLMFRGTTRIDKAALPSKCFFALSTLTLNARSRITLRLCVQNRLAVWQTKLSDNQLPGVPTTSFHKQRSQSVTPHSCRFP